MESAAMTTINFQKRNNNSNALGQYDSFVGIDVSGTEIKMDPPSGWTVKGINVYDVGRGGPPANAKQSDITLLRRPQTVWSTVFSGLPAGFAYGTSGGSVDNSVLVNKGTSGKSYEYLVWIQKANNDNDFIDPGFKNLF